MPLVRTVRRYAILITGIIAAIAALGFVKRTRFGRPAIASAASPLPPALELPGLSGILRVAAFTGTPRYRSRVTTHITTFVDGPAYTGMEDNDLRGYLDGTFKYAWNQTTQSHVRLGRRDTAPRYGEYELFRDVQRWSDITLPPHATVTRATLTLHVEDGPPHPMRVELYRVKKDWNPGNGGTLENNVSPPKPGEVWWDEAKHGQLAWGLPGVGYAATDSSADTDPMPLAEGRYQPDHPTIVFSSAALARYASERIAHRQPLLLLVKLADVQEDTPGTVIEVFSANQGDTRYTARRPHLELEWEDAYEDVTLQDTVALEYGRAFTFRHLPSRPGRWYDASFTSDSGFDAPTIEVRGGTAHDTSAWTRVSAPFQSAWDWLEVRLLAATDPVVLGQPFTSTIEDTWIRTAAPEEQVVPWVFISPSGELDTVIASYRGRDRWSVAFTPEELGRWHYSWTHHFYETPYHGADGVFDVVPGDEANVLTQLDRFKETLRTADQTDTTRRKRLMTQFARLERAAMQHQTPTTFRSAAGMALRHKLDTIRALWGHPVPDSIPMVADNPPPWQRKEQAQKHLSADP